MRRIDSIKILAAIALILPWMVASVGSASAQTCSGTTCSLGGQQRMQIGYGAHLIPIPISDAIVPRLGLVTSQPGKIAAIPGATIMQTLGPAPRRLILPPAQFEYDEDPTQLPRGQVVDSRIHLAVSTNLNVQFPNPTGGSVTLSAGGRPGPAIVSWCAGSPPPTGSFNPGCFGPNTTALGGQPPANGFVRYKATRSQFGGVGSAKVLGTVKVFWNVGNLLAGEVPCQGGPDCLVGVGLITPASRSVVGQGFGVTEMTPPVVNPTGVWTASIQANGAVALGNPVATPNPTQDLDGNGFQDFPGAGATSWGFPWTTGQLLISATLGSTFVENQIVFRTGADGRNANGSGVVSLVSGSLSRRTLSRVPGNFGYLTLKIPEPGVLAAGSSALLMLSVCHWLLRRRVNRPGNPGDSFS